MRPVEAATVLHEDACAVISAKRRADIDRTSAGQGMPCLIPPRTEAGIALAGITSSCGYGVWWTWRAPSGRAKPGLDAPWHVQLRVPPAAEQGAYRTNATDDQSRRSQGLGRAPTREVGATAPEEEAVPRGGRGGWGSGVSDRARGGERPSPRIKRPMRAATRIPVSTPHSTKARRHARNRTWRR